MISGCQDTKTKGAYTCQSLPPAASTGFKDSVERTKGLGSGNVNKMIQGPVPWRDSLLWRDRVAWGLDLCWPQILWDSKSFESQHGETAAIPRRFRGISKEKFWAGRKTWRSGGVVFAELGYTEEDIAFPGFGQPGEHCCMKAWLLSRWISFRTQRVKAHLPSFHSL